MIFFLRVNAQSIAFEQDVVTDTQLSVNLDDFNFKSTSSDFSIEAIPDTIKWRRTADQHLNPFIKIVIKNFSQIENQNLKFENQIFNPTFADGIYMYTIDFDLFDPKPIKVVTFENNVEKLLATLHVEIQTSKTNTSRILYDLSCAPYELKILNLTKDTNFYITTRCQIESFGEWGKEISLLNVSLQSPEVSFAGSNTLHLKLKNDEQAIVYATSESGRDLKYSLQAQVPKRFHRMKTALGFGPYVYQTKNSTTSTMAEFSENKTTASYMFYGRYDLTQLSSIKFFDALVATETVFNNFGIYFSYDLASALDQRFIINALLGVQGIHYRFPDESQIEFTSTAPQGFEMIYKHPFGMKNYNLTYGGFFSTQSDKPYINTWVRFGKGLFWELNYINWEYNKKSISMYGLSIGIPFLQFF
jgi:hypothetical protein